MDDVTREALKPVQLSESAERRIVELVKRYPDKKSAVMPALYLAQQELDWLTPQAYHWVSARLQLPLAHVAQVASFYTMYYKKPVGKYHFQVCRTLSCMLCGSRNLTAYLKDRLGLDAHEISEDGMWSYEEVECLGSCGTAPLVQINDMFFENLTPEALGSVMDRIVKEMPDLRYSEVHDSLGKGFPDLPRSQVWMLEANKSPDLEPAGPSASSGGRKRK